jgi:RNA polymerase sigma-70 factor (ECF subfamily)
MYRFAAWLSRDKAIAEDVVQEALLRAWKSLDSLRDDAAAKHWLLTIVRRENARYFERRRLETVDIDNLTASQAALLAETPDEELNDLRTAIFELDDDYDGLQHQRDRRDDGFEAGRGIDATASGQTQTEGQRGSR